MVESSVNAKCDILFVVVVVVAVTHSLVCVDTFGCLTTWLSFNPQQRSIVEGVLLGLFSPTFFFVFVCLELKLTTFFTAKMECETRPEWDNPLRW